MIWRVRPLPIANKGILKKLCRNRTYPKDKDPESTDGANMLVLQDHLADPDSVSVTLVRIRPYQWREVASTAENNYQAVIIRASGRIFYIAKGVVVPITEHEARQVVRNPFRYYFSTALKLHYRIERAKLIR